MDDINTTRPWWPWPFHGNFDLCDYHNKNATRPCRLTHDNQDLQWLMIMIRPRQETKNSNHFKDEHRWCVLLIQHWSYWLQEHCAKLGIVSYYSRTFHFKARPAWQSRGLANPRWLADLNVRIMSDGSRWTWCCRWQCSIELDTHTKRPWPCPIHGTDDFYDDPQAWPWDFWPDLGHDMALSICPTTYDRCVLCALLIWPDSSVWVIDMHGGWSLVRIWRDSDPKWLYDHCLEIGAYIHSFNDPTTPHFYHNNDVLRGPMTNDTQSDWTGELIMTIWFPRDDGILARGQMTGRKYDTNVAILLWQSYWERVRNQRSDFTWIELQTLRHVFVYAMCTGCDHWWQRA